MLEATIQELWLHNFILGDEIVNEIVKALKVYFDNFATVFFLQNDKYIKGDKYMKIKYFAIHKQRISIKQISTNLMIAEPLTKGLFAT